MPQMVSWQNDIWRASTVKFLTDEVSLLVEVNLQLIIRSTAHSQGSDTLPVWNFCAGFSDVISQGNVWSHHKMLAVVSG